jgi:TonB-dependent receptor
LAFAQPALAQGAGAPADPQAAAVPGQDEVQEDEIVVTGVRGSLEKAAEIKANAVQIVDAIVAQDIGKFPDPTTAAALQRVPGIQVVNDSNNELSGVRIRGLQDIITTVDGREVFTTTRRGFDLQDLPAEALSRVEVYKSQTADLLEGGVAGVIDLKLNKPFNFKEGAIVLNARNNYAVQAGKSNPALGALVTKRFDTGIGEIGILLNGTYSHSDTIRYSSFMDVRRSSGVAPLNQPGYLIPQVIQNMPDVGDVTRWQINGALQWKISPSVEAYVDGFYTYFQTTAGFTGFNPQPFTLGTTMTNVVPSTDCFDARVNANGTNPTISTNAQGQPVLQAFTVQRVCDIKSATFNNIVINQNSSSIRFTQKNKQIAGGFRYDFDRLKGVLDFGYQTSNSLRENVNIEIGQRVPTLLLETDVNGGHMVTVGAGLPMSSTNLSLRNAFNQNFTLATGSLFQARAMGNYEMDGLLRSIEFGLRFSQRDAVQRDVQQTNPIPYGNIGTATEANARLVSSLPLSSDFLAIIGWAPRLNGGTNFLGANPAYLRSERGRNELRTLFNLALRQPDWNPTRQFDAKERTYSAYVQGNYEIPLGGDLTLDGVVGVRAVKTDREISTYRSVAGVLTPVEVHTSDTDLLPAATARLKLGGGFQLRSNYSRSIRRPEFGDLNPTQSLAVTVNPFQLSTGSAGNPDLKPQQSDSIDLSAEYYFKSGFVAVTGYYRQIKDRVIVASSQETIDGITYLMSRPRNVGNATLKGIEASAQYFFDFLPGHLGGFGVLGAFTFADSKVGGNDQLAGYPLQGVSKYNYTAGLLYDRGKLSGRLVYTFKSKYFNEDNTGGVQLRPFDPARVNEAYLPVLVSYIRPAGRLDFGINLDVSDALRFDIGGTNILRNKTKQYRGQEYLNSKVYGDETTYSVGARLRF